MAVQLIACKFAKTHPCLVPFNDLPTFQQAKDTLFCSIVDSLKGLYQTIEGNTTPLSEKPTKINLTEAEIQSRSNRQNHAELLIMQLPIEHDGRNT